MTSSPRNEHCLRFVVVVVSVKLGVSQVHSVTGTRQGATWGTSTTRSGLTDGLTWVCNMSCGRKGTHGTSCPQSWTNHVRLLSVSRSQQGTRLSVSQSRIRP